MSPRSVRQSCTSGGGLLLLGLSSSPSSTGSVVTTCTAVADSTFSGNTARRANISHLARQIWFMDAKSIPRSGAQVAGRRRSSSNAPRDSEQSKTSASQRNVADSETREHQRTMEKGPDLDPTDSEPITNSMSKYLHLPKMPHRPTKEELLAAASGFGQRLKVRFKWFSIRSMRPWNADEWGAFVSWIFFGHLVWVLVGTTTFFSLIILFINTVLAQGRVHEYLPIFDKYLITHLRNSGQMDWRLPHTICRTHRRLRVSHRSKVERRCNYVQKRLCLSAARTGPVNGEKGFVQCCS